LWWITIGAPSKSVFCEHRSLLQEDVWQSNVSACECLFLYADEEQKAKASHDPVAPAKRSDSAMQKVHARQLDDGSRVHSFRSLLGHLRAIVRVTCRCPGEENKFSTFTMDTTPNPKQQKAFDLLQTIHM